jgi:hypothetical protein
MAATTTTPAGALAAAPYVTQLVTQPVGVVLENPRLVDSDTPSFVLCRSEATNACLRRYGQDAAALGECLYGSLLASGLVPRELRSAPATVATTVGLTLACGDDENGKRSIGEPWDDSPESAFLACSDEATTACYRLYGERGRDVELCMYGQLRASGLAPLDPGPLGREPALVEGASRACALRGGARRERSLFAL